MNSFKEKGKMIFFISHSIGQVKDFCQKAMWLEVGEIKLFGPVDEVIPKYEQYIKDFNKMSPAEKNNLISTLWKREQKHLMLLKIMDLFQEKNQLEKNQKEKWEYWSLYYLVSAFFGAFIFLEWNGFLPNDNKAAVATPDYKKSSYNSTNKNNK